MTHYRYALVLYTFNQADDVHRGARSVLAQDCPPLDILFSDDGSSDTTFEILQAEAEAYTGPHNISLNRNDKNLGVIEHVHRIFELTEADVIINCAGDDICHPNRAARMIETFERDHPLLACSHAKVQRPDGSFAPRIYGKASFYRGVDAMSASTSMQLYLGATSAWHREIFEKYGPVKFPECFEDLVYGFRAALEDRVAVINEELVTYRLGGGVVSSSHGAEDANAVRARRIKELTRDIAVLKQRQIDAATFGHATTHPIQRRIARALRARQIRLDYINEGINGLRKTALSHPVQTLGEALSEIRRWHKAER